jgi:hypothetical protein
MEFEPVIPVLGELDGMLRWVGRDGFSLGKQTYGLKRRNGRFGRPRMKLRRPSSGRDGDAVEQPSETGVTTAFRLASDGACTGFSML